MQQTCLRAVWAGTAALIRVDQSSLPIVPPRPNRDQYVPRSWGWIVAENSRRLAQGKDDKSWFRGIDMPCRASRKTLVGRLRSMDRFTGKFRAADTMPDDTIRFWCPFRFRVALSWTLDYWLVWNEAPLSLCDRYIYVKGWWSFFNECKRRWCRDM